MFILLGETEDTVLIIRAVIKNDNLNRPKWDNLLNDIYGLRNIQALFTDKITVKHLLLYSLHNCLQYILC